MTARIKGSYSEDALMFTAKGRQRLVIDLAEDFRPYFDAYKGKELSVEIKPFREKRSLDANALCWKLCEEIADVLRLSKNEVYIQMLKDYGQSDIVSALADVDVSYYFKYYEAAGTGTVNGKRFIHYKVFKGSSEYDRREMSILLDGIVREARQLDIPVWSRQEIEAIKEAWGEECFTKKA